MMDVTLGGVEVAIAAVTLIILVAVHLVRLGQWKAQIEERVARSFDRSNDIYDKINTLVGEVRGIREDLAFERGRRSRDEG